VHPEVEKTEPQLEPKPQAEQVEPQPEPQPLDVPKLAEAPNADAVLPTPAEQPPIEKPPEEKSPEPPKPEEKEASRPQPQAKKAAAATTAPKPVVAPRAKTNAAPSSGTASAASIASWRGTVVAHLNRHKRYPGGGARGTSSVAFTIDRSGRVISARLIRSSGSGQLDQEAVSLARRASPVPAPPPNIAGRSIVLTVPIRFSR
jgi:protein TonB